MDRYKKTFNTWNKIAQLYQDKFMDLDLYDDTYDIFCQSIKKTNAHILEIGCGPGNITRYISSKKPKFKIKAIDIAPKMIELARVNCPAVDFEVMDCREIDKIKGKYDGIIAGFCLPYLAKEDGTKFLQDCCILLNKDAILYLSVLEGNYNSSSYQTGSTGDQAYVYYYEEDYLLNELKQAGFDLIELVKKEYVKSKNEMQTHLIFIARKD